MKWQPIETAPEFGDDVDVYASTPFNAGVVPAIAYDYDTGEALYLVWYSEIGRGLYQQTHWMPLPPPPEAP